MSTLNIQLKPLSHQWIDDILKENKGNIAEYFIPFKDKSEVEKWVDENIDTMQKGVKVEMIILDQDNQFHGMVSLRGLDTDTPEVGLWIKQESQNKGIAKRAMQILFDELSKKLNSKSVVYDADKNNVGSNKLALALDFKFQKEFVDNGVVLNRYLKGF